MSYLGWSLVLALLLASASMCSEAARPQFHFSPKRNWMNDPNGLVYYEGEYHLYFQHNPLGLQAGNLTWGHAVSPDLVHWTELEPVLRPDSLGLIFSGSAVVDWHNVSGLQQGTEKTICAFYTAAGDPFTQCIAYSHDRGRTFTKYAKNPIIKHIIGGNRDPKVFRYAPGNHWVMALYLDGDEYAIFNSTDLLNWQQTSSLHFPHDGECPDLFELPIDGDKANTRWVFVAGTGSYFIGTFDGKTFKPTDGPFTGDYGAHYYATQTYSDIPNSDGRRIQITWMRGGEYPGMPFNQQQNFPCECTLKTFPDGIRMCRVPVKEIEGLRTGEHKWRDVTVSPNENLLAGVEGELFDIKAEIELKDAAEFGFRLRGQDVRYTVSSETLSCLGREAAVTSEDNRLSLRILVDRNSVEVYAANGRAVFSSCFVPNGTNGLEFYSKGGRIRVVSMNVWPLKSAVE